MWLEDKSRESAVAMGDLEIYSETLTRPKTQCCKVTEDELALCGAARYCYHTPPPQFNLRQGNGFRQTENVFQVDRPGSRSTAKRP